MNASCESGRDRDARAAAYIEIWQSRLAGVCDEMGAALRRAAYSPNIKEREDFSCALFSPDRELVGQAEHIPVHLGSMVASVESALQAFPDMASGDQVIVNDPFAGGTHLNDVTLVCAARDDQGRLLGYVANRAHHADIGGAVPGSLSATVVDSVAEGLCLPPIRAVRASEWDADVRAILLANTRTPVERSGDLDAQWGANRLGVRRLVEFAQRFGPDALEDAMHEVCDYSERRMRVELADVAARVTGPLEFSDVLEAADGELVPVQVSISIDERGLTADFAGTGAARPGVPSGVAAVTQACLEFCARSVADPDIPRNGGVSRALHLELPKGSVVDAEAPVPVGVGNIEASQRIADVLLGALAPAFPDKVGAASQGTMNNLLIGSAPGTPGRAFVYYETIGGGQGGRPHAPGQSGIHTAMTNTANTPVEAIEADFPITVERYGLRRGSGGDGANRGGDGIERALLIQTDCIVTFLGQRRSRSPWGLAGGSDGASGEDTMTLPGRTPEPLGVLSTQEVPVGTRIVIGTPGGGGYGEPGSKIQA